MKRSASLRESPVPITGVLEIRDALHLRELTLPRDGFYAHAGKRLLDLVLVIPLLVLATPIIVLAAAAVVFTSGWPAFYRAQRVGKDGREFSMWKLRTMRRDADTLLEEWLKDPRIAADFLKGFKFQDDSRITRIGSFLRRTSIDELPQLLNVLRGEMSLVGHRPVVESELVHYSGRLPELLAMRPGITGLWQIGGRNKVTYPERAAVELGYGKTCGLTSDLAILVRTLLAPLRFDGR
jgi:lipopolysaccharide/colanic/teichoic acid biosynthesis glycosyltransferase